MARESLKVRAVHFEGSLDSSEPFEDSFGCPVFYNSDDNKLVFEKEGLFAEQPFAHSKLANSLDDWIEDYLSVTIRQKEEVSTQVQKNLLKHLACVELDQPKVAKELAMSTRMLQRKLQEEGTIYA